MKTQMLEQWLYQKTIDTNISIWIEAFMKDRRSQGVAKGTMYFYSKKLQRFMEYCDSRIVTNIEQISPEFIRDYLIWLEDTGHNEGGRHAFYRSLKTFLNWWEEEVEPENWRNPIRKVKVPTPALLPLKPISPGNIQKLINVCDNSYLGRRDKAIFLTLFDTGLRSFELSNMDIENLDLINGSIYVVWGKGKKNRIVFLSKKTRKAIRAYMKVRNPSSVAVWQNEDGERMGYWGLRDMLVRRSEQAGFTTKGIHDFRRAFCLQCLRNGMDLVTLQRLSGHSSLKTLKIYLDQVTDDLQRSHAAYNPVDTMRNIYD